MTAARKAWWQENAMKLAILLFGAGVAWSAVKIESQAARERQAADHAVIEVHEARLDEIEQCISGMAATNEAMLRQMEDLNENVRSINEFLRDAAQGEV